MAECERLTECAFFKEYEKDPQKRLALQGFIKLYCKGEMQGQCIRKKVSGTLGGPENVPVNMMPNGKPLPGTDESFWLTNVKRAAG